MKFNWLFLLFLEYSLQLTHALKHAPNDGQIKAVFGRQIMALHQRCIAIKVAFAREAHASGKYHDRCSDESIICSIF